MQVFREIAPLQAHLKKYRNSPSTIGFVPTMGALHRGHLSLVEASRKESTVTVCSIYVNPTQFNNKDDFEKYPKTLNEDLAMLEKAGTEVVFCPGNEEMYDGAGRGLSFDFGTLGTVFEGAYRPGHFSGVALVVSKLFHIVGPDFAYFGQKDFQQFKIISRLVEELKFYIALRCVPTVREKDGLAMSSRNMRLNREQRADAPALYEALAMIKEGLHAGKKMDVLSKQALELCSDHHIELDYLALADEKDLSIQKEFSPDRSMILVVAGKLGGIRLIDNLAVN